MRQTTQLDYHSLDDNALASLAEKKDPLAVRLITERNNQRLFRVAVGILKNRADAEDAVQTGYLRAFAAISDFRGDALLSTWLTRIVINEALQKLRRSARQRAYLQSEDVTVLDDYRDKLMQGSSFQQKPDEEMARDQIRKLLERAVESLPRDFRLVLILREIEGLSIKETADSLEIPEGTVKTRHLRARRRLQEALAPEVQDTLRGSFPFAGADCDKLSNFVVDRVCKRQAADNSRD